MQIINLQNSPTVLALKGLARNSGLSKSAWESFVKFTNDCEQSYGVNTTVKILKDINSKCRHYAVGHPKLDNAFGGIWFRISSKSGIPVRLKSLEKFIDVEPNVALAIPNEVYKLRSDIDYDTSSITEVNEDFREGDWTEFKQWCGTNVPRLAPSKVGPHISLKGGPNGPAAISQAQDAVAVLCTTWPKGSFAELIKSIYKEDDWFLDCWNNFSKEVVETQKPIKWKKGQPPLMAKLAFLSAVAGKTRIVYVLNWWIQQLLLPIHDSLMNFFKSGEWASNDATWDQDAAVTQIQAWSACGYKLYSFDLKAATDRWPIAHQQYVIKAAFGSSISDTWFFCLKHIPPYLLHEGKHIFYSSGQPMGAFSSWASLNITHHSLLRWICDSLNKAYLYVVLGDDLVIADKEVAERYLECMSKLGVKINLTKSISAEEGLPSSAEFARNLVRNGEIVGTWSPNLIHEIKVNRQWFMAIELIREFRLKLGFEVYVTPEVTALPSRLYKCLGSLLNKDDLDRVVRTLTFPSDGLKLPRTRIDSINQNSSEYVFIPNPWKDYDTTNVDASLAAKQRERDAQRMNDLNDLQTLLAAGSSTTKGHLLDSKFHPLQLLISDINEELSASMWAVLSVASYSPPKKIDTDLLMLKSILAQGLTYRQYRETKNIKLANIMYFIDKVYKDTKTLTELMERNKQYQPIGQPTSWEDWAKAFENQ